MLKLKASVSNCRHTTIMDLKFFLLFFSPHLFLSTWSCCWTNLWRTRGASRSSCFPVPHSHWKGVSSGLTCLRISRAPWRLGSTARPRLAPCRWLMRPPWRWWRPSSLLAWRWNSRPCWGKATARTSQAGASGSRRRQNRARTWSHPQR